MLFFHFLSVKGEKEKPLRIPRALAIVIDELQEWPAFNETDPTIGKEKNANEHGQGELSCECHGS